MEAVLVNKNDLLEKLYANRDQHKTIFAEAMEGYKAECIKQLEEHLAAVKSGKIFKVVVSLPVPEEHTRDYDRAITMVEMSVNEQIEIDEHSFSQYVMDDWGWKRAFLVSNSGYSGTAARLSENL